MADCRVRQADDTAAVFVAGVGRRTMSEHNAVDNAARRIFSDEQAVPGMATVNDRDGRLVREERQPLGERQVLVVYSAGDDHVVAVRSRVDCRLNRPLRRK